MRTPGLAGRIRRLRWAVDGRGSGVGKRRWVGSSRPVSRRKSGGGDPACGVHRDLRADHRGERADLRGPPAWRGRRAGKGSEGRADTREVKMAVFLHPGHAQGEGYSVSSPFAMASIRSERIAPYHPRLATQLEYEWLIRDLNVLGWAEPSLHVVQ
jgi:hypothetical protein